MVRDHTRKRGGVGSALSEAPELEGQAGDGDDGPAKRLTNRFVGGEAGSVFGHGHANGHVVDYADDAVDVRNQLGHEALHGLVLG